MSSLLIVEILVRAMTLEVVVSINPRSCLLQQNSKTKWQTLVSVIRQIWSFLTVIATYFFNRLSREFQQTFIEDLKTVAADSAINANTLLALFPKVIA